MVAEVERRVASGDGLEVKGIKVDTNILLEALELHSAGSASQETEASKEGPRASARWSCASGSSRWSPGEASSSLLTSKAIMECEQAEPFLRSIELAEGASSSVPVFQKPDVLEKPLKHLEPGKQEVVARFLSRCDGRVYLRLKAANGWVSTRSCEDMTVAVLMPAASEEPLEPAKFRTWPLKSPAVDVLPLLESAEEAQNAPIASVSANAASQEGNGQDGEQESLQKSDSGEEAESDGDESAPGDSEDAASAAGSVHEDVEDMKEDIPKASKKRLVRKFRILSGRVPVLRKPGMSNLLQNGQKMLLKGETFLADGVFWAKSEQRAYLRMTRGLGWICERSRNDLWRLGIVRLSQRRSPVSKKMARAVAFRGGDTGGVIRLQKDDLTKNSRGRIVSKRASEAAKKRNNETIGKWTEAVKRARAELNVSGFAVVKKGTELYEKAQEHFRGLKWANALTKAHRFQHVSLQFQTQDAHMFRRSSAEKA